MAGTRPQRKATALGGSASEAGRVLQALSSLCEGLQVGDKIPTHTALMRQFDSSERFVRQALDQLVREGRIVRRNGAGTFVAQPAAVPRAQRTLVAIVHPDRSFFDRFMGLLYRQTEEADLRLVCHPAEATADARDLPSPGEVIGTILFGYVLEPLAAQMQAEGHRVVLIGSPPYGEMPRVPCIFNDHERGGSLATKHLIDLGHRRIAFCGAGKDDLVRHRRRRGHLRALAEAERAGLSIPPRSLPKEEVAAWASDPAAAQAFFAAPDAPTAILAWNDSDALKMMASLARAGISVPDHVSIVGYDALPEGEMVYPSLTTVEHGIDQQAAYAIEMLSAVDAPASRASVVVLPNLLVRESTAPPPLGA